MFDYQAAFSRNLGWVTEAEQAILRGKRIAIAGLGGVGGSHLLTLTRLGIGSFRIADFDHFEIQNFNRQAGASVSHLGQPKVDVMAEMAKDINPELDISCFPEGVNAANLDEFLDGVDLYVDSLDFFALDIRNTVFNACAERGIPAVTAAPLGMGSALLVFMPGAMTYEEYFRMSGQSEDEQALRFMLGLAPARLQLKYLADDTRVDFNAKKGPSTPMACELCAGFAGTYALKILLGRGDVPVAPKGIHFDAYRNKLSTTWRPGGNNHPVQRLGLAIARKMVMAKRESIAGDSAELATPIERVLDLARWAPSGDNEQPWRFEQVDEYRAVIYTHDTRDWCIYDLDGSSSQIAVGALLENVRIAASGEGMKADIQQRENTPETALVFDVQLREEESLEPDSLISFIRARTTQRKPLATQPLLPGQKSALEQAVGPGYRVIWLEGADNRRRMAKLLFNNAHIRLSTPEAYEVHKKNIEWGVRFSDDRLPEHALGLDLLTRKVMRFVLKSWGRVKFANRFFAGTWLPRLQMDLLTGLKCAAHFVIVAEDSLSSPEDFIRGGGALQRFWLEATRQNLQLQPEMTPVIFSRYVDSGLDFTAVQPEQDLAVQLSKTLTDILGSDISANERVFMGRVGFGAAPTSRSIRLSLQKLALRSKP
jgi:sulfur-carrier protein adenylyltransferase/sulfurtransferase